MEDLFGNLFAVEEKQQTPLADRMRPARLEDFVGQEKAVGRTSPLRRMIERDMLQSILFYGPPGTGKTTLAQVIAHTTGEQFVSINAVSSGVPELRKLIAKAQENQRRGMGRTIVFIDEIHRFNKAQQDVLLPYVENGTIVLIGATTENPFFEINSPLLSRMKVIRLEKLQPQHIVQILQRAIADPERGYGNSFTADAEALEIIGDFAAGDARGALNLLEQAEFMLPLAGEGERRLTTGVLRSVIGNAMQRYDKKGDQHYDIVSAFIKSMRGSDADAALHYLARMIEGGEDLRFIARRIVICAAEDVGLADPQALVVANAAAQAADFVGLPEARIPLAEAVCYIANAPKSNTAYMGIDSALADVRRANCGSVPKHLRDAHYPGAKALGHGLEYKYPHSYPGGWVEQQYLPDELVGKRYYIPSGHGQDTGRKNKG
ncbi:replication-associated recombination protein A [Phascolarctobacterium sp.]|uniref:replication-associated recombination protein A n=1 Tax=Phascolarctobacterium sp. TaxID=2049039 RepID=UPI00386A91CC